MNGFIKKFDRSIIATLCCFDRVIFKRYLPFGDDAHLNLFVDRVLKVRRKDFIPMLEKLSHTLVAHAKALAEAAGRPYEYRQGKFRKETLIENIIRRDAVREGLVAVLCCQETCRAVKLRRASGRPELVFAYRPQRVLYAVVNFGARDILTFLGRKLHGNFAGEVLTDAKKDRAPGARIKHRVKDNWLKMYDKFGQILRVETVINDPREFRVRRRRSRNGTSQMVWCPMNKGVANFYQFERLCRAANERYLDALAVVDDPTPSYQQVERLAERKVTSQRSYAGFNPASKLDVRLFQAVLQGDHLLHGFYNRDIRRRLGLDSNEPTLMRRYAASLASSRGSMSVT